MNSNPSQKAERNKSPRKTELQEIQAKLIEDRHVEEKKKSPALLTLLISLNRTSQAFDFNSRISDVRFREIHPRRKIKKEMSLTCWYLLARGCRLAQKIILLSTIG